MIINKIINFPKTLMATVPLDFVCNSWKDFYLVITALRKTQYHQNINFIQIDITIG